MDYNIISTQQLQELLKTKSRRYNKIMAKQIIPRRGEDTQKLAEQMTLIKAVIFAREATLRLEGF